MAFLLFCCRLRYISFEADAPVQIRRRQNNALLNALAQKTNALKSVTIDIYDNARSQETIDHTVCFCLSYALISQITLYISLPIADRTNANFPFFFLPRVRFSPPYRQI
jgi:hypothetical protein